MADLAINLLIALFHDETRIIKNAIRAQTVTAAKGLSIECDIILLISR